LTSQTTARWGEPVDPKTYTEVGNEVDWRYGRKEFQEAYDLMEETWPGLPEDEMHPSMQDCLQFKAFLLAHLGRSEETLEVIRAALRSGYSWGLSWGVFDSIRDLEGYPDVEKENQELIHAERDAARREVTVMLPEDHRVGNRSPLCILLHGDGDCSGKLMEHWTTEPLLKRGFIVAFVQSSQLVFTNRFAWLPDPKIAWDDIRTSYMELCEQYTIDEERVLLCGFSGGAITTVDLVFGEAIPAAGFICLCPEFKPERFTPEAVKAAAERGVRGAFLEGSLVWPLDDEQDMMDVMQEAGFPIQLILNEDLGHAFPSDFEGKFEQALRFVLGA